MRHTRIPLRLLFTLILMTLTAECFDIYAQSRNDSIYIRGRLKESLGKNDLTDGWAVMLDKEGNPTDSVQTDKGLAYRNDEIIRMSVFGFTVPKTDSIYYIQLSCPKYTAKTISYEVKDVGKREEWREIPTVYLDRAPRELDEVTVTATKIKFYNRGDTVVYNADAFELAEGSMLDALITQLPGVELKEGGQILVNGEQVESLLLNGREFFDDNNELMLENIGAYSVKNVEVYKGNTTEEKLRGLDTGNKHLTMDVKLKREFNTGLTANAQAGYGTSDRYMGRLFGLWFNSTTRLTLLGNVNNLNDTRKPGQKDSWKPEMMPSGTRKYKMASFDYNYMNSDETNYVRGDLSIECTDNDNRTTTATTNFLTSGNTYENSFANTKNRNLKLSTRNYGTFRGKKWMPTYVMKGYYIKRDNDAESLSGAFSEEQQNMTIDALRAIYSDGSKETLNAILNRASTRSDGSTKQSEIQFFPGITYFIPKTEDNVSNEFGVQYKSFKEDMWKDYTVNYGNNPIPADVRRQYIDNNPHTALTLMNNLTYYALFGNFRFKLNYEYRFLDEVKDSYQYALDRLEDMGVYGVLPSGWTSTLDPNNSYTSRLINNTHTISPSLSYNKRSKNSFIIFYLAPEFAIKHSHFDYERNNHFYPVRKSFFLATMGGWDARFTAMLGSKISEQGYLTSKHDIDVSMNITPKAPDVFDMVSITDDSNPLNIYVGNPDLKVEYTFRPDIRYQFNGPASHPLMNVVSASFGITKNALTRGYTYDTTTGVRTNKMYNVDGNRDFSISDEFSLQFGPINQFTIDSRTNLTIAKYADMIGVNGQEPTLSKVDNNTISERLSFSWQIGKQSISLNGEFLNRHSFSSRPDFQTINANHFSYGVVANFKLPFNIGFNTDFNIYTRRGYGVKELDTSDAIWNARLTWTPPKAKQWTFMLDGFDMLHQLSNVNYAVTATGRVVSYSNALPRYVMLSIQYRFHRQPKRR
ncbi:MAG: outer membrane beta-barrel family protein [Muribaculum sp.]|nr:outer membrane beta-barrel family protein [Muribaculum sp.]